MSHGRRGAEKRSALPAGNSERGFRDGAIADIALVAIF